MGPGCLAAKPCPMPSGIILLPSDSGVQVIADLTSAHPLRIAGSLRDLSTTASHSHAPIQKLGDQSDILGRPLAPRIISLSHGLAELGSGLGAPASNGHAALHVMFWR